MAHDPEDVFSDFEAKVSGKEKKDFKSVPADKKDELKNKFQEKQKELMEQYKKERNKLAEKERKEQEKRVLQKEETKDAKPSLASKLHPMHIERIVYLAIILLLVIYIVIDATNSNEGVVVTQIPATTQNTAEESQDTEAELAESESDNETEQDPPVEEEEEAAEEETESTPPPPPAEERTGSMAVQINNVINTITDEDNDIGEISEVEFTIANGQNLPILPHVTLVIYDSEMEDFWQKKLRGEYAGTSIDAGENRQASISVSPRFFSNLNVKKTVILVLNNTLTGDLTSTTTSVEIE